MAEEMENEEIAMGERAVIATASSLGLGKSNIPLIRAVNLILPQSLEWQIPFLCQEAQRETSNEL